MIKEMTKLLGLCPPYLLIIIACAIWALNIILLYPYTLNIPSEEFNLLQYFLGVVLILPWMLVRKVKIQIPKKRRDICALLFLGIVGSAIAGVCFVAGLQKITPSSFSFIQILQPFWVLLVVVFILKKRLAGLTFSILIWMVLNFILIAWPDLHLGTLFNDIAEYPLYMLMASSAMVIWGTCTLVGKYLLESFNIESVILWRWSLSFLAALFICVLKGASFEGIKILVNQHFFRFFIIGGVLEVVAMSIYYLGLKKMKSVNVAILELSYPAFGIIFSSLYTYEGVEPVQIFGMGALLLFMITLAAKSSLVNDTEALT